jgi:hypothetical protein
MTITRLSALVGALLFLSSFSSGQEKGKEFDWPREVQLERGLVTFYQPQPESFTANILEGRSAISYKPNDGETLFGAYWFRAFLQTDIEKRVAVLDQVDVLRVKFPGLEDTVKVAEAARRIERELEAMNIVMSLDHLVATLDETGSGATSDEGLNHSPPVVYYRKSPTVLISVDGDPIWKEMENENLRVVVNSPFFIVQDKRSNAYFIHGGEYWYTSDRISADAWKLTSEIPSNVEKFAEKNEPPAEESDQENTENAAPDILVVTEPSEIVVTEGEPDYKPIEGTDLLYVSNTDSDIIMDINTQHHYILMAGRWYKAKQLEGDKWTYEEPESLPDDFSEIPADSEKGNIRASVPGTDEARDALLEQSIPQTAEVVRAEAKVEVNFDGPPKFKRVPDTDVAYAENSDKQVMKIGQKYYVVDNGIWFISDYPEGPYEVSDHRPQEVDQLPADVPVYNTKYVYVYDATPEVVYVGYLPGYTYSYVYGGTVVYGTGYRYPYWYGSVYYPRPVTYGFNVHWNPYTGWGFSFGFSAGGWIGWGYHPYYRSYWGPCGYRTGYRHGYYHGYNRGRAAGYAAGYRAGQRNAYLNQRSGVRNTTTRPIDRSKTDRSRVSNRANNLYADKDGNVFERDKSGNWNQKSKPSTREGGQDRKNPGSSSDSQKRGQGTNTKKNTREVPVRGDQTRQTKNTRETPTRQPQNTRSQTKRPSTTSNRPDYSSKSRQDLNRSYQNRQRSQQNFNRSQSSGYNRGGTPQRHSTPSRGGSRRR